MFSDDRFLDLTAKSLLQNESVAEAKTSFLTSTEYIKLLAYEAKLKKLAKQRAAEDLFGQFQLNSPTSKSPTLQELMDDIYGKPRTAKPSVNGTATSVELEKLEEQRKTIETFAGILDPSKKRVDLLIGLSIDVVESSKAASKWLQLLASLLRTNQTSSDSEQAKFLYSKLPTTTLAVLLDEPTQIRLENERVILNGGMRYRYATTLLRARNGALIMSEGEGPTRNSVETIAELTNLANGALPILTQRYAPLQRVTDYAKLAAFLRWARRPGNLLSVDLSALGEVRSSDRSKTPTPDAIAQSGS